MPNKTQAHPAPRADAGSSRKQTTGDDEGEIAKLRERLAQIQKWQHDVEEREAACCPEDVPFGEYIRALERRLAERPANA